MKIVPVPFPWTLPSDEEQGRSAGVHLSDLVSLEMHKRDPERFPLRDPDEEFDQDAKGRMTLGLAWEAYDLAQLRAQGVTVQSKVEHQQDGIILTPDGETPGDRIWEWKLSYKSSAKDLEEHSWWWFPQIMGYAFVCGLVRVSLRVAYVCGDWKPPSRPHRRQFDLTFTSRELHENWRKILGLKKEYEKLQSRTRK